MPAANNRASHRPCLVLAHAEPTYAGDACRTFRRLGWDVYPATTGPEVRRLARMLEADLVVLDVALLEETGWLTCAKLTQERPGLRVVLVTDKLGSRDQSLAEFVGAQAVVSRQDGMSALVPASSPTPLSAAG